ncbi:MAG: stage II sporulation protein P [Firmicutes bacterium]|nr:stage II sporulation protein P [Bacillota bacterium]
MKKIRLFFIVMLILAAAFYRKCDGAKEIVLKEILYEGLPVFEEKSEAMYFENSQIIGKDDVVNEVGEVIGKDEISFDTDIQKSNDEDRANVGDDMAGLRDLDTLRRSCYIVDQKTAMTSDLFDVDKFMAADLRVTRDEKPRILVFHTHAHEMFADSKAGDINEGIVGAGNRFCEKLEEYGIKTIHITDSFDTVDGRLQIMGAYERMEPVIIKVLEENPSIEMVIDMHRDGVNEDYKPVTEINGKSTAKIMLFNGLCRINENGSLTDIAELPNPYLPTNLALSFRLQNAMMKGNPGFSRGIYLNAYRYSLNMKDKSILAEVGAQTNTKEEIYNAVELFAKYINDVTM